MGHARAVLFTDYSSVTQVSAGERLFYAATAFGHQAVMIFFVLSGFFVGGGVLASAGRGWNWTPYLVNRFTRLYVVLVPGLALTAACDLIGYAADPNTYVESCAALDYDAHARLTPAVALGNRAQLQTLLVPTFGSNGPLWSLCNEAWYYLIFPALALPFVSGRRGWTRAAYFVAAVTLAATLLRPLALYFVVWCFGVAVALLPRLSLHGAWAGLATAGGVGAVMVALAASRQLGAVRGDFTVGLATAVLVYAIICSADARPAPAVYGRVARWLAGFSFTLYIVHLPAVVACRAVFAPEDRWTLTPVTAAAFCLICGAVTAYAYAVSLMTEAHTDSVRRWLGVRLTRPRKVQA